MKCKISTAHRHKITLALAKEIKKLELLADANDADLCRLMLNGAFEALCDDLDIHFADDGEESALKEEFSLESMETPMPNRYIH